MIDNRQTDNDVPGSSWPTRAGLALAGFLGGLLYIYFLILFVGLWMRTQSFSPIQVLVYFGTPALELLALLIAPFMGRKRGAALRNLLMTVWLANVLNLVLTAIGTFTF